MTSNSHPSAAPEKSSGELLLESRLTSVITSLDTARHPHFDHERWEKLKEQLIQLCETWQAQTNASVQKAYRNGIAHGLADATKALDALKVPSSEDADAAAGREIEAITKANPPATPREMLEQLQGTFNVQLADLRTQLKNVHDSIERKAEVRRGAASKRELDLAIGTPPAPLHQWLQLRLVEWVFRSRLSRLPPRDDAGPQALAAAAQKRRWLRRGSLIVSEVVLAAGVFACAILDQYKFIAVGLGAFVIARSLTAGILISTQSDE